MSDPYDGEKKKRGVVFCLPVFDQYLNSCPFGTVPEEGKRDVAMLMLTMMIATEEKERKK